MKELVMDYVSEKNHKKRVNVQKYKKDVLW
jgi:hypothetical protein